MASVKLVLGATGNVGGALVEALAAGGESVRAVARANSASREPRPGVEWVDGDLDDEVTLIPHLTDAESVFLLSGYAGTAGLVQAAEKAQVEHLVVLSAAAASSQASAGNAVAAYHRDTEALARASGCAWTILRPVAFMSNALRWREEICATGTVIEPFPNVRAAVVDPSDVAAVAAVAMSRRTLDGAALLVSGQELLYPRERLAILGEAIGRPLTMIELEPDAVVRHLAAQLPARYVEAFTEFYLEGRLDEAQRTDIVLTVTGRHPRTFADWAVTHADNFRP